MRRMVGGEFPSLSLLVFISIGFAIKALVVSLVAIFVMMTSFLIGVFIYRYGWNFGWASIYLANWDLFAFAGKITLEIWARPALITLIFIIINSIIKR